VPVTVNLSATGAYQMVNAAELQVYLASEDAGFITGQCYLVNGGMYFQ